MDIVKMPQEDYSQDTLVQSFEKQHKAEGIGLNMQNLSYTYHNGTSVFADASIEAYPHEIAALAGPSGGQDNDAAAYPVPADTAGGFFSCMRRSRS